MITCLKIICGERYVFNTKGNSRTSKAMYYIVVTFEVLTIEFLTVGVIAGIFYLYDKLTAK